MPVPPAQHAKALLLEEPEAFDRWFRAEHPVIWKLCFGFLACREDADDAAQEALLRLHDRLGDWDQSLPYGPWRNTLVANLCRDRLRRRRSRAAAELEAGSEGLPDRLPAPDDLARADEIEGVLQRALLALSDREREVFVLRELEGQATEAVALALGITASSVRSISTLARRRLRGLLAQRMPGLFPEGGSQ